VLGFLLEPVGVFCVFMVVIMVPMILWKALVGTVNAISPPLEPQKVPFIGEVAAELQSALRHGITVYNREKRHPDHPSYNWVEFPRDPEDPMYQWTQTEKRKVPYQESEDRNLPTKTYSVEVSGEDVLTVYLGQGRKKYAFFYCGREMWRCEFMFRDPSWRKAVKSSAWVGSMYVRRDEGPDANSSAHSIAAFLVDLPQDIQDGRLQKPEKLVLYEATIEWENTREVVWEAAEAEELKLWLASGKSKRAFRKYLKADDDALYDTALKLWMASGKSEESFARNPGEPEAAVEVDDGYGEDAPVEDSGVSR